MAEIAKRRASTLLTMAGLVMVFSLFSKIFGLIREQVLAAYFGATSAMDVYNIAFYLPNLIRMLLVETTLSSAFIPVFSSYLARKDRENVSVVANTVTNLVIVFFTGITILLYIFVPNIVSILPSLGETPYLFNLTVSMTRIMLPTLLFMSLTGLAAGLLNSYESFGVPAFSPVVFNLVIISSVVGLSGRWGILSLGFGVLMGTVGQFVFQLPFLRGKELSYRPLIRLDHPGTRQIFAMAAPLILALGCVQINISVDKIFALTLPGGSVATLNFASLIWYVPLGVFAGAIATVLFPSISRAASLEDVQSLRRLFSLGAREIIYLMLPATAGLMALSVPMVRLIYERGQFDSQATANVALALLCFAVGLLPYSLLELLNKTFYSMKDARTPFKVALLSIFLNFVFDWILIRYLSFAGLALSTSLVGSINFILLLAILRRRIRGVDGGRIANSFLKIVPATLIMITVAYFSWDYLDAVLGRSTGAQVLSLGGGIFAGLTIYTIMSILLKIEELQRILTEIRLRIIRREDKTEKVAD